MFLTQPLHKGRREKAKAIAIVCGGTSLDFATFTDPVQSVRCAIALVPRLLALGVPSRFGLH